MLTVDTNQLIEKIKEKDVKLWALIGVLKDDERDVSGLLEKIARDQLDESDEGLLDNAIATFDGDMDRREVASLARAFLKRTGNEISEDVEVLLQTVGFYNNSNKPAIVKWAPLDNSGQRQKKGFHFQAAVNSKLTLTSSGLFDPDGKQGGTIAAKMMHLAIEGGMSIGADGKIPLKFGSIGLSSHASGQAGLVSHYLANPMNLFAQAAVANVNAYINPMSLKSLAGGLAVYGREGLQGFTVSAASAVGTGVTISLVKPTDILSGLKVDAGVKLKVKVERQGDIAISTYKESADTITVVVDRAKTVNIDSGLSVGIKIDPSELLGAAHTYLSEHLEEFSDLINKFEKFTEPSKLIRGRLKEKLQGQIDDEGALALLNASLGFDKKTNEVDSALDVLVDLVGGKIAKKAKIYSTSADDDVDQVIDSLVLEYPFLGDSGINEKVRSASKKAVAGLLEKVQSKISELTLQARQKVAKGIMALNKKASKPYLALDAEAGNLLSPVLEVLNRYHGKLQKVAVAIEKAAQSKLTARLYTEREKRSGSSIELKCQIHQSAPKGQEVFESILRGDFDEIFDVMINPKGYLGIEVITGELTKYAKSSSQFGFEVIFMDINLSRVSIMTASAKVTYDHAGTVSVLSDSLYKHRVSNWEESREIAFFSAYQLVAAKSFKQLSAGLTLTHADEDLDQSEVNGFLSSLENYLFLAAGTTSRGESVLTSWERSTNGADIDGEIAILLNLNNEQLAGLIKAQPRVIAESVIMSVREVTDIGDDFQTIASLFDVNNNGRVTPDELIDGLMTFTDSRFKQANNVAADEKTRKAVKRAKSYYIGIHAYVGIVGCLRAIYEADASASTQDYYIEQELKLNGYVKKWLKVNSILFFVHSKVRPQSIAFLMVLRDLIEKHSPDGGFMMSAQMIQNSTKGDPVIRFL